MDAESIIATLGMVAQPGGRPLRGDVARALRPDRQGDRHGDPLPSWSPVNARTGTASTPTRCGSSTPEQPLRLSIAATDDVAPTDHVLGIDLDAGEHPQIVVPTGAWQAAVTTGGFTLVSCTVSPGFEFAGFELAPPGWAPGRRVIAAD